MRGGLGTKQEIGASVFGLSVVHGGFLGGGKVSYKIAPLRWLALVAGGGAYAGSGSTFVIGGDLAAIVAPYMNASGTTSVYTGARGSFASSLTDDWSRSEGLTVPIGLALPMGDRARFFVEGGFLAGWNQYREKPGSSSIDSSSFGGYGLVAVMIIFR